MGWFNPNVEQDLLLEPDVIIPRPGGMNRRALAILASRGSFDEHRFPVRNLPANNVPSLAPWNHARWVHRFRTPTLEADARDALVILERAAVDDTSDPPRRASGSAEAPAPSAAPPE